MNKTILCTILIGLIVGVYSISQNELDEQKIFYGSTESFSNPACIKYNTIVQNTEEYKKIIEENIEQGTARYWTYLSEASNSAIKIIIEYVRKTDYDLIVEVNYLNQLNKPIECMDITNDIIEYMNDD